MKQIGLTVLEKDVDKVIEFLGRRALMQFSNEEHGPKEELIHGTAHGEHEAATTHIQEKLGKLRAASGYIGVELPLEPDETSGLPGPEEDALVDEIAAAVFALQDREDAETLEKKKIEAALNEAKSFANLNAPFAELDQLSYLALRVGRLDPRGQEEMRRVLADRAVIIPLGKNAEGGDRVVAAASRKGRFALDSELKKHAFVPISIPEGFRGVPPELLAGLEKQLETVDQELARLAEQKAGFVGEYGNKLRSLVASYLIASTVERIKGKIVTTRSVFFLSGWVPAAKVDVLATELSVLTGGKVGIRAFSPEELSAVQNGTEKVPVSLKHGAIVSGFEPLVYSYGAPKYGTIDPTPLVAFFFTLFFGIMFGDLGQGFVLLMLGLLIQGRRVKFFKGFSHFAVPLITVGIASMITGLLYGSFFSNETLLEGPTRTLTTFLVGHPENHILELMPQKGNLTKLFYFFGFAVALGILLNSLGLILNIVNRYTLKDYERAFFSKNGLAGLVFFWYALSIAVRAILGKGLAWFDTPCLVAPLFCIFFGPLIWRLISGERPIVEGGLFAFIMEGFVEILETLSGYISSTVSFLRVGAFALSHTVLSFIVFTLTDMVWKGSALGPLFGVVIVIFGNLIIILLEGMIVAIQVVRLQYYEFFSKFFTETGVAFNPFRFRKQASKG
jgi:V/A-type H+-transporting ATPase subunit I